MSANDGYPCTRCQGKGRIPHYANVLGGVCFKCGGSGLQKNKPAMPSRRWSVNAVRTTDRNDCVVFHVRARTEKEAIRKARDKLVRASHPIYDASTVRVEPWPETI